MTEEYCGFVCSDVVEKAREIRKELDDFAKENPEEARKVWGNVLMALFPRQGTDEELGIDKITHTRQGPRMKP